MTFLFFYKFIIFYRSRHLQVVLSDVFDIERQKNKYVMTSIRLLTKPYVHDY